MVARRPAIYLCFLALISCTLAVPARRGGFAGFGRQTMNVTFHNEGDEEAHVRQVSKTGNVVITVRDDEELQSVNRSLDLVDLLLHSALPKMKGWYGVSMGATLTQIFDLKRGVADLIAMRQSFADLANLNSLPVTLRFRNANAEYTKVGVVPPGGTLMHSSFGNEKLDVIVGVNEPIEVAVKKAGEIHVTPKRSGGISIRGQALDAPVARSPPPAKYNGERWQNLTATVRKGCQEAFASISEDEKYFCSAAYDQRTFVRSRFDVTDQEAHVKLQAKHRDRERLVRDQPKTFQNLTETGFEVQDVPEDLLQRLQAFHRDERLRRSRPEAYDAFDPNLSQRESDTWTLNLPRDLSEAVYETMRPILAKWVGLPAEELERQALYGLRLYHAGSQLYSHVDRRDTHAISAILEVAHLGDADGHREPWPLHIVDHSGHERQVPDRAGQAILYESATCAHGRPGRLRSREMANVFVHFRPKGWPGKFLATASHGKVGKQGLPDECGRDGEGCFSEAVV